MVLGICSSAIPIVQISGGVGYSRPLVSAISVGASCLFASTCLVLLSWGLWSDRSLTRDKTPRCPTCKYDLTGRTSLVCPECGRSTPAEAALFRKPRRKRCVALALLAFALACGSIVPHLRADGRWIELLPDRVFVRVMFVLSWTEKHASDRAGMRLVALAATPNGRKLLTDFGRPRVLDSNDPATISIGILALTLANQVETVLDRLRELSASPDPTMRATVVWDLLRNDKPFRADLFAKFLDDPSSLVVDRALHVLAVGPIDPELLSQLTPWVVKAARKSARTRDLEFAFVVLEKTPFDSTIERFLSDQANHGPIESLIHAMPLIARHTSLRDDARVAKFRLLSAEDKNAIPALNAVVDLPQPDEDVRDAIIDRMVELAPAYEKALDILPIYIIQNDQLPHEDRVALMLSACERPSLRAEALLMLAGLGEYAYPYLPQLWEKARLLDRDDPHLASRIRDIATNFENQQSRQDPDDAPPPPP